MRYIDLINKYKDSNSINKDFEYEGLLFIICEYFNINRSQLTLRYNDILNDNDVLNLESYIDKYINHNIPVQYLFNCAYFYNNKYYVNESVLIPRFDTEVLVDNAIRIIKNKYDHKIDIIDVGTGSGCIAISLKEHLDANVIGIDISSEALDVARINSKTLKCDIELIKNDLLKGISKKVDVIISNPPYIANDEKIMDLVYQNEPHLALFSSDNGLYHYKRIIDESFEVLKEDGILFFEIPDNKCDMIIDYAHKYYSKISVIIDYNNQRRVLVIER